MSTQIEVSSHTPQGFVSRSTNFPKQSEQYAPKVTQLELINTSINDLNCARSKDLRDWNINSHKSIANRKCDSGRHGHNHTANFRLYRPEAGHGGRFA